MASDGNNLQEPPHPHELEISILGPGWGECVILHLGHGDWGVVDSCLDPATKQPAALPYFQALGVDAATAVRFVIASHWHDDHLRGLGELFQAATSALFACTKAVRQPEFGEILAAWTGTRLLAGGSGIDEFRSVLVELKKRSQNTRWPSPKLAMAERELWGRLAPTTVSIRALSPSDAAVLAAVNCLAAIKPAPRHARRRLPDIKPNDASVVLSVRAGEQRILLGGDLEVCQDSGLGWRAIVNGLSHDTPQHQVFKVPHHGSSTAYDVEVWDRMLAPQPWAVTTPFVSGRIRLPSRLDARRILGHTPRAYLTALPQPGKFRDNNRTVEKTVAETTLAAHFIPGKFGQVRLRKGITEPANSPWRVELFGQALSVRDYVESAS